MTWGFSRDDVEASFFSTYLEQGVFPVSPFESLDTEGVGVLVRTAVRRGPATRPDLHLGVCGEHGGDPASIHFFDEVGLDYVSCSPFRVPVARLEAGRARSAPAERRDAAQNSAEASACRAASTRGSSLPTAPKSATRCSRARLRSSPDGTPDEVDQPVEGVLDVAAEHVEVGHHGLRVDVVGAGRRGVGAGGLRGRRPGCAGAPWPSPGPAAASASAGLRVDELLVLRDRPVDVAVAERVLGGGVARVDRRLVASAVAGVDRGRAAGAAGAGR